MAWDSHPGLVPAAGGGAGERFADHQHAVLIQAPGIELRRPPADSAFRYLFLQVDGTTICGAISDWTIAQIPGGATGLDQLICNGKTMTGSIVATAGGSALLRLDLGGGYKRQSRWQSIQGAAPLWPPADCVASTSLRTAALNLLRLAGFVSSEQNGRP